MKYGESGVKIFTQQFNVKRFFYLIKDYFKFIVINCIITFGAVVHAQPVGDSNKGATIAQGLCAGCHAADGNSVIPLNPIIAGQHADYLKKQLNYFQVKEGASVAKRENAVMGGIASGLSEADIENLSAYYSQQKIKPSFAQNIELAKLGEKIYRGGDSERKIPSCASCHGPKGLGIPGQYPRVSGQHATYSSSTLTQYKNGIRKNNKQMMEIASRLSEKQIEGLAEYLAGLN